MGRKCFVAYDVGASFGGTADRSFNLSLPVTGLFENIPFVANCRDTGSGVLPVGTGTFTTTNAVFRKANVNTWTLAATSRVYGSGWYLY